MEHTSDNPENQQLSEAQQDALRQYSDLEVLTYQGKTLFLLGTAHVSQQSVDTVRAVIAAIKPDTVAVELCPSRYRALFEEDHWQNMNIFQVLREGKATVLLANLILSSFQKRMGAQLGVKPGQEMVEAIRSAQDNDARYILADREVQLTLKRAWGSAGIWSRMKLISTLIASLFAQEELTERDLEKMRNQDMLSEMLEEFARHFPRLKTTLIDERDQYLAKKVVEAPGSVILAVVGAGHRQGMRRLIESQQVEELSLSQLNTVPKPSPVWKSIKYLIPAIVIGIIAYGFFSSSAEVSWTMIQLWVLANGVLAALFVSFALPHPITILTAFVAAPLTSLNPTIAAGWVAGLMEAWLRKPKVSDLMNLSQDAISLKGFWKNRITKILLVVVFANVGSSIGTFVGIPLIASLLR
ncbi:TraB/GumN family protein [Desulfurispirillum indicum]|uniref:TraB/GumN family protein n=1 Tax=Desulfurispirillum indicum TaxID=936456 RepID=UPI001CF9B277|nr:TraB/GumN family protein [Desulfurispirillum indicum]UCZ55815.1 TraB/GumN family protein [Desulfurispirillum indicum]